MARNLSLYILSAILFCFISCVRTPADNMQNIPVTDTWSGARPMAILRTGEYPLWFQLTEDGPVHIESIEDAVYTSALVPWPYALYICYLLERDDALVMVVNRDGFLKIEPDISVEQSDLVLYRFSGGDSWQQYTIGGFVYYDNKPAALLYLDNRFIEREQLTVSSEQFVWSFNMESNNPFPIEIPVLQMFFNEGWTANTLRYGNDDLIYYRVTKRSGAAFFTRMFRTKDLEHVGEEISIDVFFNSVSRQIDITHSSLQDLPEGFVYTGIKYVGDSLFVSWEEQEDYSIGAAGFMVIKR